MKAKDRGNLLFFGEVYVGIEPYERGDYDDPCGGTQRLHEPFPTESIGGKLRAESFAGFTKPCVHVLLYALILPGYTCPLRQPFSSPRHQHRSQQFAQVVDVQSDVQLTIGGD